MFQEYQEDIKELKKDPSERIRLDRFLKNVLPSQVIEKDGKFWCFFSQNEDRSLDKNVHSCPYKKSLSTRQRMYFHLIEMHNVWLPKYGRIINRAGCKVDGYQCPNQNCSFGRSIEGLSSRASSKDGNW